MSTITVTLTGRRHPVTIDGIAAGLRTYRDDAYLQFFIPVVPADQISHTDTETDDAWWSALVDLAVVEIRRRVSDPDFTPAANPGEGILLPIPAALVAERRTALPLPLSIGEGDFLNDETVATFQA